MEEDSVKQEKGETVDDVAQSRKDARLNSTKEDKPEAKTRNRRMFGNLLGHLSKVPLSLSLSSFPPSPPPSSLPPPFYPT
jgi:hypothetical protein